MARAATTTDAFNAVAEPRRRQILDLLAQGERPVNDLVVMLGLAQPQVSKHLRVLRDTGFASVRADGTRRLYAVRPTALRDAHAWLERFRRFWTPPLSALETELVRGRREARRGRTTATEEEVR